MSHFVCRGKYIMLISDSFLPTAWSSKDPLSVKLRNFFFWFSGTLFLFFSIFYFSRRYDISNWFSIALQKVQEMACEEVCLFGFLSTNLKKTNFNNHLFQKEYNHWNAPKIWKTLRTFQGQVKLPFSRTPVCSEQKIGSLPSLSNNKLK